MKLARLLGITMSLLTHEKMSAKEFAKRYEVSVRTILRDMDELGAAGIPIVAQQGNNGGFSILESFRLERNFLTIDEMKVLKTILKGFEDSVIDEESKNILNKLRSISSDKEGIETQEDSPIVMDFSGWADPIHLKNMVSLLKKAVESNMKVHIQYFNNNGYETERVVHPYHLLVKNSAWYLHGYCERADDFRVFKVSRMKVVHEIEETFERTQVEVPSGSGFLGDGQSSEPIVLLFQKEAFSRLFDFFERSMMEFQDDGTIIVRVSFPIDEWIYYVLFGFSDQVEVLEPLHLRQGMKERIEKMNGIYS